MPAGVYNASSSDFMLLPHNISKFDGGRTNVTANKAEYVAVWFLFPTTINSLGFIVRTADAGSTDTRVCICDQHPTTGLPNTLLFGSGHIDTSVTGYQSETLGSPIILHGLYWFGFKTDSTTLNITATDNTNGFYWGHPNGIGNGAGRAQIPEADNVVGAWPATAALTGTTNEGSLYVVGYNGV